jgi:hypothetical protein
LIKVALPLLLSSTLLAALLTGLVNVVLARRKSREEERSRIRTVFAEAFATYASYREYPYVVRRRNPGQPAAERVRISEQIRQTQERLSYYLAWTKAESAEVGQAYAELVRHLRTTAGVAMREAWKTPAVAEDAAMNIADIDLGNLKISEDAYTEAVSAHLNKLTPWWAK